MSQVRRKSTGNKGITVQSQPKDQNSEAIKERKSSEKQGNPGSAKSSKTTGASQTVTRQLSIREQLKQQPKCTKGSKCTRDKDNRSPPKSPPKKRMNSDMPPGGENTIDNKERELNPDHEELKRQIFAGIKLMLDSIKEDIKQIKLDQRGLKEETKLSTGRQLQKQIVKNEEKQKKLETRISALEDQLLEKNVIFQGLDEDEFDDIQDTKTRIISAIANVSTGNTPEERKETAKKTQIDSIEWLQRFNPNRGRLVKVKFTNKTDIGNLFKNRKKLPEGVFIDKEYSKATEKERRLLRPILRAAQKIEDYKGRCKMEGPYFILDGKKYHWYNVHTLPAQLDHQK